MSGPFPRQHLFSIGLAVAVRYPDLFGAPLYRGLAEFRRDGIGIDQLLSKARVGGQQRGAQNDVSVKLQGTILNELLKKNPELLSGRLLQG